MIFNPLWWQRIAHALYKAGVPVIPALITKMIRLVFAAALPHQAEIARTAKMGYAALGVVLHKGAKIGERVELQQNVTLGGNSREHGGPTLEDDVYVGAGARILGPITVGRGSVVAANAVVIRDVPPHCVVGGVPARILRENIDAKDFLFHRHDDPRYQHRTDRDAAPENGEPEAS